MVTANGIGLVKVILGVVPFSQTVAVPLIVAVGVGLTTTVAVIGAPTQPAAVGVMVNVTVIGAFVVLVNVPLISPLPLAAMPVTVPLATSPLFLVQWYTVPVTLPVSAMVVIGKPEHFVCEDGVAIALGVGLTVMVNVLGVPGQLGALLIKLPIAKGLFPTGTVATTVLVAPLITDTLAEL